MTKQSNSAVGGFNAGPQDDVDVDVAVAIRPTPSPDWNDIEQANNLVNPDPEGLDRG